MPGFKELVERLRALLLLVALFGIVLLDSASRIMSMLLDGMLVLIVVVLIWPLIKGK